MRKFLSIIFISLFVLTFSFGQGNNEISKSENLRIISLAPNITEIVYALGAGDELVGRSDYCNYPSEVLEVANAGNVWQPNVELIVSLEPDVVLAASLLDPSYKDAMERAGINVVHILSEENIDGTYDLISQVGSAIDREKEAEDLCREIRAGFEAVENAVSGIKDKKSCVYLLGWGMFGDYAATGDTFINDIIELAGGVNIAHDSAGWSISKELLISENPDLIILPDYEYAPASPEDLRSTEPYSRLTGKIITINGDIADRQGVRSPLFALEVAKALYPEAFN